MTRAEFTKTYCDDSNITQDELTDLGRIAVPCDCGEERCQGWRMQDAFYIGADELDQLSEPYKRELLKLRAKQDGPFYLEPLRSRYMILADHRLPGGQIISHIVHDNLQAIHALEFCNRLNAVVETWIEKEDI